MPEIPVRNLWLLMLYASYNGDSMYKYIVNQHNVEIEDNPNDIADLIAEMLCRQVKKRLMRNLSFGYQRKEAVLTRVRGRIDILTTECHRLLDKGKVRCRYDELTIDTPRNRYVRAALQRLAQCNVTLPHAHNCRTLALRFARLGVGGERPVGYSSKTERFGFHDSSDRNMLVLADLAFALALPTQADGNVCLPALHNTPAFRRRLFEKAVGGFYKYELDNTWNVEPGKRLTWQQEKETKGIAPILPKMQTDIYITQNATKRRLVIDTKFTSITTSDQYGGETLHSKHIYQMYAYLRSQEKANDAASCSSMGMLLHPVYDREVDESVTIQGHRMRFCTVNLAESAESIRERLLHLHKSSFSQDEQQLIVEH